MRRILKCLDIIEDEKRVSGHIEVDTNKIRKWDKDIKSVLHKSSIQIPGFVNEYELIDTGY